MDNKIPAKKSLGQNFLKSKLALFKMLEAGEVNGNDIILEVGPGKGALTEKLLEKAKKVIAVEKDNRLIDFLKEKFQAEIKVGKFVLVEGDILDFEPSEIFKDSPFPSQTPPQGETLKISYKLIANIPYYITGQFLRKFLESDCQPERIVVMVQKEIADRIVANNPSNSRADNKESLLSISVKAYGTPKKVLKVNKENFSPAPKVDSAILLISNISKEFFTDNKITEKDFFEILHAGFAHKRKILLGNLKEWQKNHPSTYDVDGWMEKIFSINKIDPKIRAEDLSLNDWLILIKNLK